MLQKQLAFVLNTQKREPTGQRMRQCTHLSKKSLCHTYQNKRQNWGYPRARNLSGKLMFGQFTDQKNSETG
jgi:hypothetical protein